MFKCGDKINIRVYRCDSGYKHSLSANVLDVVKYETIELGNNINYDPHYDEFFASIPAIRCKWVTLRRKIAYRYGKNISTWITKDAIVVGDDGEDGGYLIVE